MGPSDEHLQYFVGLYKLCEKPGRNEKKLQNGIIAEIRKNWKLAGWQNGTFYHERMNSANIQQKHVLDPFFPLKSLRSKSPKFATL